MDYSVFFFYYIFPPLILLLGVFGNIFGLIILSNKALDDIGPKLTYQYLFISDSAFLFPCISIFNLQFSYNLNVFILSNLSCKLISYFTYAIGAISPWLIIYISIDRYISTKYPARRFFPRKIKTQHIMFWLVTIICIIFYIPVSFFYEISYDTSSNSTASTPSCNFIDPFYGNLILYTDLAFRVFVPFVLMIVFSGLLSQSLFASRTRIVHNFLAEENATFYKEIRLTFTSLLTNLVYILTQLPGSIAYLYPQYFSYDSYVATFCFIFLYFALNFYILFFTNSLFRENFFKKMSRSSNSKSKYFSIYLLKLIYLMFICNYR